MTKIFDHVGTSIKNAANPPREIPPFFQRQLAKVHDQQPANLNQPPSSSRSPLPSLAPPTMANQPTVIALPLFIIYGRTRDRAPANRTIALGSRRTAKRATILRVRRSTKAAIFLLRPRSFYQPANPNDSRREAAPSRKRKPTMTPRRVSFCPAGVHPPLDGRRTTSARPDASASLLFFRLPIRSTWSVDE